MGELEADRRALALHEGDQRLEAFDLGLAPDAEVVLIDEADLLDRCGLDEHQPETAQRVAPEMYDMECATGVSGVAAIMHHRRHHEAIAQREASNAQGLEQHRPR